MLDDRRYQPAAELPMENTSVRVSLPFREVSVVNWPVRDDPLRAARAACACVGVGLTAGFLSGSWSMGCLAAVALAGAMWRLWVPVRCELDPQGMTLSTFRWRQRLAWRDVTRVEPSGQGILLCGDGAEAGGRLWPCVYLPWRRHRELVCEFREQYGPPARVRDVTPAANS